MAAARSCSAWLIANADRSSQALTPGPGSDLGSPHRSLSCAWPLWFPGDIGGPLNGAGCPAAGPGDGTASPRSRDPVVQPWRDPASGCLSIAARYAARSFDTGIATGCGHVLAVLWQRD